MDCTAVVVVDEDDGSNTNSSRNAIAPPSSQQQQPHRRPPPHRSASSSHQQRHPPPTGAGGDDAAPSDAATKQPPSNDRTKLTCSVPASPPVTRTATTTTSNNAITSSSSRRQTPKKPAASASSVCTANLCSQFAIESYLIWFSALIFCTELLVDVWLAALYFRRDQPLWALATAGVVVVPLALCQLYSLWLLRTDGVPLMRPAALGAHVLLFGIVYRYHGILRRVERAKISGGHSPATQHWTHSASAAHNYSSHQQQHAAAVQAIRHRIGDVNAIQTMNATLQYCPQFMFQSFLIVYCKYKCILTGVSAGLAGFSFLWHIFIHLYYLVKRHHDDHEGDDPLSAMGFERCYAANVSTGSIAAITSGRRRPHQQDSTTTTASSITGPAVSASAPHIIDNLSSSTSTAANATTASSAAAAQLQQPQHQPPAVAGASGPSSLISINNLSQTSTSLCDSLRTFEKPQYSTDDRNLMSKQRVAGSKMVEKSQIFGFNKRRPIYQQPHEDFDMNESAMSGGAAGGSHHNNASTVFFEIDDDSHVSGGAAGGSLLACSTSFVSDAHNTSVGGGGFVRMGGSRGNKAMSNRELDNFLNENHSNKKTLNDFNYSFGCVRIADDDDDDDDIEGMKRENRIASSTLQLMPAAMGNNASTQCHVMDMSAVSAGSAGADLIYPHGVGVVGCHRNSLHKRKGICSSQEMLHLVDIMNDHISAEQVDVLAKSLVELGDCSLLPPTTDHDSGGGTAAAGRDDASGHHLMLHHRHQHHGNSSSAANSMDHSTSAGGEPLQLDHFPAHCEDRRLLENIDAAIYENQIIFQERIRKNQLTIQNLKLQDQMLSKCIEDMKAGGRAALAAAATAAAAVGNANGVGGVAAAGGGTGSEVLSVRDYENMCFTHIARQQRGMKHWRNYLQDMDTSQHDASTVQHSSYYVNTNTAPSDSAQTADDLYIDEDADDGGASTVIIHDDDDDEEEDDDAKGSGSGAVSLSSSALGIVSKKGVRWSSRLAAPFVPRAPRRRCERTKTANEDIDDDDDRNGNKTTASLDCSGGSGGETTTAAGGGGDVLYINMNQHLQRRAARWNSSLMMDASTTTTRGSNSSVVVELDEDDEDEDGDDGNVQGQHGGNDGAVALPQKNILVETINKINVVDSPVKSLLGELKSGFNGGGVPSSK